MTNSLKAGLLITAGLIVTVVFNACTADFLVLDFGSSASSLSVDKLAEGATLYTQTCSSCHGDLATSQKLGRSASQIISAGSTVSQMNGITGLSTEQIQHIAAALGDPKSALAAVSAAQAPHVCTIPTSRGSSDTGMRRLTAGELVNTLTDLIGGDTVGSISSIANLPSDSISSSITEFTNLHSDAFVRGWFDVAIEAASLVGQDTTKLSRIAPTCVTTNLAGTLDDACVLSFIDQFATLVHRRPLTADDRANYLASYKDAAISALPTEQKVEALISQILSSPQMMMIWLDATAVPAGQRSKVDAYTVASRLSYELTGSMPDSTLMATAVNGSIMNSDVLKIQGRRLLETSRGHMQLQNLMGFWTGLNTSKQPTANAAIRVGAPSDDSTLFWTMAWAKQELVDYADYVVYNKNGTFTDLMTSAISFPRYQPLATAMGTGLWTQGQSPILTPNRAGLAARPALLFNNGDRESPIKRGVMLRTKFLCEGVPPPPASLDSAIGSAGTAFDQTQFSSRDVASKITSPTSCSGCHASLNSLGFALGAFGPMGEYRTTETTYKSDGTVAAHFPVNTSVSNLNVVSAGDTANGLGDLNTLLAQSSKAKICFARNAFRISRLRAESDADACQLADIEQLLISGASVKDALLQTATSDDIYWRGY